MTLHKSAQMNGAVIRGKLLLTANSYDRTGRTFPRGLATAAVRVPAAGRLSTTNIIRHPLSDDSSVVVKSR